MTVKQIIKMASKLLQKNEIAKFLDGGETTIAVQNETNQMLDCYNSVICELAEEYLPLKYCESFENSNGQIAFSEFSKAPLEIVACFKNSQQISFKQTPLYLIVPFGNITVAYQYQPEALTINDENAYNDTKISGRIIALGVAREYLLCCGLYSEAMVFDNRFRQALSSVLIAKKHEKLRARGWF